MTVTEQSSAAVGVLFKLTSKENLEYYYQNFLREEDFLFDGAAYSYLPVTYVPPQKNITLAAEKTEFKLPNKPVVLEVLVANNYFKDAVVEALIVTDDFPTSPAIAISRMVCRSYAIDESSKDGQIKLICGKVFNAINGQFPNCYFTTGSVGNSSLVGYIPEIPLSGQFAVS